MYAKAKIDRYAGDLPKLFASSGQLPPQLLDPVSRLPANIQNSHLEGDKWAMAETLASCMKGMKTTVTALPTVPQ